MYVIGFGVQKHTRRKDGLINGTLCLNAKLKIPLGIYSKGQKRMSHLFANATNDLSLLITRERIIWGCKVNADLYA